VDVDLQPGVVSLEDTPSLVQTGVLETESVTGTAPSMRCAIDGVVWSAPLTASGLPCVPGTPLIIHAAWSRFLEARGLEALATDAIAESRAGAREHAQRRAAARRAELRGDARRAARRKAAIERARERAAERRAAKRAAERREARRRASEARRNARGRSGGAWRNAPIVTWYGPGFYGNRTACGVRYTRTIIGVAHRTLPCGTLVQFRWHGITAVAPVIDRGPFATKDYVFDFSAAMSCEVFKPKGIKNACFTRYDVRYRVVGKVKLKSYLRRQ
jgi:rare lipoprotein A (peptidoglycan hydrolase)